MIGSNEGGVGAMFRDQLQLVASAVIDKRGAHAWERSARECYMIDSGVPGCYENCGTVWSVAGGGGVVFGCASLVGPKTVGNDAASPLSLRSIVSMGCSELGEVEDPVDPVGDLYCGSARNLRHWVRSK